MRSLSLVGWIVLMVLVVHGLIHVMGFAKAFGFAELPQLSQPISRGWGLVWLAAAILVLASALAFGAGARSFWMFGAVALVVSQLVIVAAWRDAWAGTLANLILVLAVAHGWFTEGPLSFRAQFMEDARVGMARLSTVPVVTEADLERLPPPVARYLRVLGVVGQPRVASYHLRFTGRIRSGPDAAWMPFEAEQYSFVDRPTRLFLMRARMFGVPVESFHRLVNGHATMEVKVAGLLTMVDAHGDVMDRSETVTLFNDMSLLAPATLIDPAIAWEPLDARSARARFTNGRHTIAATLLFDDDGHLTNFVSDDRARLSPDGKSFTVLQFSTPVRDFRALGGVQLASHGDALWHAPEGEFVYGQFDVTAASFNVGASSSVISAR